jgi:predicted RNA polymerase sigma factor
MKEFALIFRLSNEISKYHLEAGIAYWHTNPCATDRWQHILHLYNQLILIEYSPMTVQNSFHYKYFS